MSVTFLLFIYNYMYFCLHSYSSLRLLYILLQLHKVNAATLVDWLKKRGVTVKSKEKKADLADKVQQYLALVPHEQ